MLTLHEDGNTQLCEMVHKKKSTPVYWHPKIQKELMNDVENLDDFNDEYFRDDLEISRAQAIIIFDALKKDVVPDTLQQKYFKAKRIIHKRLLTEMDLENQKEEFRIDFPPGKVFAGHHLVCSATAGGKTYFCAQKILHNLKGPEKDRRRFIIVSAEYEKDKTLDEVKLHKYEEWVQGIDVSDYALKESEWGTPGEFFQNEVQVMMENAPEGAVVFLDDFQDSCCPDHFRRWVNRGLRVLRHSNISLLLILHSLRSGAFSSQAHNSVKYLTVFPRSQKAKIVQYLNQSLGLRFREAEEVVRRFAQSSRHMTIHLHAPEAFIGKKLVRLM